MKSRVVPKVHVLLLLAILATLSSGPVSAQDRSVLGASGRPGDREALSKASKKRAVDEAIERYATESDEALASRLADLRTFFQERKARTRLFSAAVLSIWGKLSAGAGLVKDLAGEVGVAFGEARAPSNLDKLLAERFRNEVLDPAEARKAVDAAISGFLGDLKEIEGRLLVKLKADLGDDQLSLPWATPAVQGLGGAHYESMIRDTVNGVTTDLGVSLAMTLASNYVGNKLAEAVVPEDTSDFLKFVANVAVGIAVDKVAEEVAKAGGYDAEKEMATKINSGVDQMAAAIIDGDPATRRLYPTLGLLRWTYPDKAIRDACTRADEAVMKNGNPGLQRRLAVLRNDRYRRLWVVLTEHLIGAEAAKAPLMMYEPLDPKAWSPPDYIIKWAVLVSAEYEGRGR